MYRLYNLGVTIMLSCVSPIIIKVGAVCCHAQAPIYNKVGYVAVMRKPYI